MNLVIANDDGRLSDNAALQMPGVHSVYALSANLDHFLDVALRQNAPFVLAWHEVAAKALKLLGQLNSQGSWPAMLSGVVLFRAADYAGYRSRADAEAAIHEHQLDPAIVHILSSTVSDPPISGVVARFSDFARELHPRDAGPPPYFLLEPEGVGSGLFTAFTLASAAAAGVSLPSDALNALDWPALLKECSEFGITACSPSASWTSVAAIADQLRDASSHRFVFPRLCNSCDKCRNLGHTYLERVIPMEDEPRRSAMVNEVCSELKLLALASHRLPMIAAHRALEKMSTACRLQLAPSVLELMKRLFTNDCILFRNAESILQTITDVEPVLQGSPVGDSEVDRLADLVRCENTGEVLI